MPYFGKLITVLRNNDLVLLHPKVKKKILMKDTGVQGLPQSEKDFFPKIKKKTEEVREDYFDFLRIWINRLLKDFLVIKMQHVFRGAIIGG